MTIHCAIMYFDSETESGGYLLGSDSRAAIEKLVDEVPLSDKRILQVDKSFRGRRTVGFFRGALPGDENNPHDSFSRYMQSLENLFDDIDEGVDYSHVSLLNDSEKYVLLVGKQTDGFLDLYTVSNARENDQNIAKRLHRLTSDMYHTENKTMFWYAPNTVDYFMSSDRKKLDVKKAQDILEKFLTILSSDLKSTLEIEQDYEPGIPIIYRLNFQGIQRIKGIE